MKQKKINLMEDKQLRFKTVFLNIIDFMLD